MHPETSALSPTKGLLKTRLRGRETEHQADALTPPPPTTRGVRAMPARPCSSWCSLWPLLRSSSAGSTWLRTTSSTMTSDLCWSVLLRPGPGSDPLGLARVRAPQALEQSCSLSLTGTNVRACLGVCVCMEGLLLLHTAAHSRLFFILL